MQSNDFGTDPKHLHRADAPQTSVDAANELNSTHLEAFVYKAIKSRGERGCIASDLIKEFPYLPYSSITARFKALGDKGYIRFEGTRQGKSGRKQRVMIANVGDSK